MNARERWVCCMHFQSVDYVPDEEFGYWEENSAVWQKQGLPKGINLRDDTVANQYFGFSSHSMVPVNLGLIPGFETKVIEETHKHRVFIDTDGVKKEIFKDGSSSIPHFIDFPLKGRKEWEELFKPRLKIDLNERYPENRKDWEQIKTQFNDPNWDKPVGIYTYDVKRETLGIPKPENFESQPEIKKIKSKWKGIPLAV